MGQGVIESFKILLNVGRPLMGSQQKVNALQFVGLNIHWTYLTAGHMHLVEECKSGVHLQMTLWLCEKPTSNEIYQNMIMPSVIPYFLIGIICCNVI